MSKLKLQDFVNRINADNVALLIIDEIGTATPGMIAAIDQRLRQVFDEGLPLGGCHCIFTGDLWQLPSFDGCLAHNMIKYQTFLHDKETPPDLMTAKQHKHHLAMKQQHMGVAALWRKGCEILALFKRFHLKTQQRAKDIQHLSFIESMTTTAAFSINTLMNNYQPLSQYDLESDPDKWDFAPYIVATIRECINLNYYQAIWWAKNIKHMLYVGE